MRRLTILALLGMTLRIVPRPPAASFAFAGTKEPPAARAQYLAYAA
jgi:hypothetical protein